MKKVVILSLTALLAACSSSEYTTEVKSESYREDYKPAQTTAAPVAVATVTAEEVKKAPQPQTQTEIKKTVEPKKTTAIPAEDKVVKIVPPSQKQEQQNYRFGYTIQVVAVGSQDKVSTFSDKLPKSGQPIWQNYKVVNGTKWYSVLYGDFATKQKAKSAIATLPKEFQDLKPFVRSIDKIKKSDYPTLSKIN
ncbi:SPOR domain-containing protein [Vibrio hangzhouensis]|uniref:Sporulation related domain-containing protein n=1 Tax=Vibrio hangzhouensis TaxID=462991 RepID=A0A1H5RNE5_9VIBR|nr:SPOR domain-containing protein [Vibrio hangzhouensis]SEF39248.1 Sporulation related domain-containing protein [Vibrio hangzhouensis]